jgi:hypothetical protein
MFRWTSRIMRGGAERGRRGALGAGPAARAGPLAAEMVTGGSHHMV